MSWEVLSVKDNKALLLCDYVMDFCSYGPVSSYNYKTAFAPWCSDFYNSSSFSDKERQAIASVAIDGVSDQKFFFLSKQEFQSYFPDGDSGYRPLLSGVSGITGATGLGTVSASNDQISFWFRSTTQQKWIDLGSFTNQKYASTSTCANIQLYQSTYGVCPAFYLDLSADYTPQIIGAVHKETANTTYDGRTYALYDVGMTWFEAKAYCEKMGGHLVTITSSEEQTAIEALMGNGGKKQYWMGLNLFTSAGQWITGEPCTYTNWDRNEPDEHTRADGQHEYYVHIYNAPNPAMGGSQRFKWNDMYYDNTYPGEENFFSTEHCGFICEWEEETSFFAQITYNNYAYNLLSQPVNIQKDSATEVTVTVNYTEGAGNERIYLSQDTTHAVELTNGIPNNIRPGEVFEADQDIYILIINEGTEEAVSERTKLKIVEPNKNGKFMPDSGVDGLNFKLGKEIGFKIPDCIPIFNGTEIKWEFDFIPISVEYDKEDENKINVVFGTNIAHSDGEEDKYFKDFDFKEYKKDFKKAASKQGRTLKQLRNDFDMSNDQTMNLFGGKVLGGGSGKPSFGFNVAGYAEMRVIDGELRFIEGQLCLEAEISYTYQGQLFIWVVPVYYEIGGGIGAGFEGDMINIAPETFIPQFEAYLTAKIEAKLGAGVGVAKVATVGVGGEGSLNLKSALHKDYLKCWGEGGANVNVKLFGKTVARSDFIEGDFLIYETGNANGWISDDAVLMAMEEKKPYAAIDINRIYENESRDYAELPTQWYGDYAPAMLLTADYTNKNLQSLAENTYTEAAPQMCSVDGQKVMVMLWDGEDRRDANRTMVVWSAFDESTQTWSSPQPVHDDGTADFYPCFKDGYLVWQNEKVELTDDMTLADIASLGEICAAKWNGNGFGEPVTLTDNDTLDTLPSVCSDGQNMIVTWVSNSVNDILGITGNNTIQLAVGDGKIQTVSSDLSAVTNLTVGYVDGLTQVAYVIDSDNDLQTTEDWELYLNNKRLTNNGMLDSNPIFAGDVLFYYAGGNICFYDVASDNSSYVFEEIAPGLTDTFAVSVNGNETAIWWSGAAEGGTEVFCALKKEGAWSGVIQLSEMENQCRYPTGVLETDGTMYLAFCNSIWANNEIVQNDLYTLQVIPSYDLAVENVYVDETTMKVYAIIRNEGQLNVDGFTVSLTDPTLNNSLTISDPLKAGSSVDVEINYLVPEDMTKREVTFSVSVSQGEEFDLQNNSAQVTVGNCDLQIQEIEVYEVLPQSSAMVTIANTGYTDAEKVLVQLRQGKEDGTVVAEQEIPSLSAGENTVVSLAYDVTKNENVIWYVTVVSEDAEMTLCNNAEYFVNACANNLEAYESEILQCKVSDDAMIAYTNIINNTDTGKKLSIVVAVYRADGQQKCIAMESIHVDAYANAAGVFGFRNYAYEEGDYLKMFVLDSDESLKPVIAAEIDGVNVIK